MFRKLHSLAPRWYGFCLQLGVKELDQIKQNGTSVDDCLVLALQSWLKGDSNWKQLITAIYQPAGGGNQRLATDVAESFRGIMQTDEYVISAHTIMCTILFLMRVDFCNIYVFLFQICAHSSPLHRPVLPALHKFVS